MSKGRWFGKKQESLPPVEKSAAGEAAPAQTPAAPAAAAPGKPVFIIPPSDNFSIVGGSFGLKPHGFKESFGG